MQRFTPQQQLENCKLALRLWKERVKPEQVTKGLNSWTCGTQACFGGWLATWPEFRALGIVPDGQGAPIATEYETTLASGSLSRILFGDRGMLFPCGLGPAGVAEENAASAYEAVVLRLEVRIAALERRIAYFQVAQE